MEPIEQIESAIAFYDQCEVYHNCTVQVLTNTKTGDVSVGWWRKRKSKKQMGCVLSVLIPGLSWRPQVL